MSSIQSAANQEITKLNYQFLMVVQKQLLQDELSAKNQFGIDQEVADFLKDLPVTGLQKMAESGICTLYFRFGKECLPYLTDFVEGDDLAICQALLCQGVKK